MKSHSQIKERGYGPGGRENGGQFNWRMSHFELPSGNVSDRPDQKILKDPIQHPVAFRSD